MAITKFKITRAPIRATLEIASVSVVVGQEYPISQQAQMVAKVTNVGVPYDDFGFRLGNSNNIWSEEFDCTINVNVDGVSPTVPFPVMNHYHYLNQDANIDFIWSFNDSTDRIRFTQAVAPQYGTLRINGLNMILNKTYFLYEFIKVVWHSEYYGILQNVSCKLNFQVGNVNEWSPEYELNFYSSANMIGVIDMLPLNDTEEPDGTLTPVNATGTLTTA